MITGSKRSENVFVLSEIQTDLQKQARSDQSTNQNLPIANSAEFHRAKKYFLIFYCLCKVSVKFSLLAPWATSSFEKSELYNSLMQRNIYNLREKPYSLLQDA